MSMPPPAMGLPPAATPPPGPSTVVLTRPPAPKGWLATFVALLILLGIPVGGFVAAKSVAGLPDQPIDAGHGVIVAVPEDWQYRGRFGDERTVLLSRGGANVAITVKEGTDERAALADLRNEWVQGGQVSAGEIVDVGDARPAGQPSARFPYSGTFGDEGPSSPVEGEVTGVRGSGIVVLFDAWAGKGQFLGVQGDVGQIIRGTTIP